MIRPEPLTTDPLVMPSLLRLATDGERITSCWYLDGDEEHRFPTPEEWIRHVTDCWKSSEPRSDERWCLTNTIICNDAATLLAFGLQLRSEDAAETRHIELRGPLDGLSGLVVHGKRFRVSLSLYAALAQVEPNPQASLVTLRAELATLAETFAVGGHLPLSLAGIARRRIMALLPANLMTPWSEKQIAFEQAAVTAGRIEVAGPGVYAGCRQYDRSGSYTADMATERLPESATCTWTNRYRGDGIYEVDYEQPDGVPLLRDAESKTFQLAGHGIFCSPELDELRRIGGRFTVRRGLVYHRLSRWLAPLAETCWDIRQSATTPLAMTAAKHLPLFAYGIFLSKGERRAILDTESALSRLGERRRVQLIPNSEFAVSIDEPEHAPFRFPALGAFVLAYGRVAMHRAMVEAVASGGRIISTYVDNLVVQDGEISARPGLGNWREEAAGYASVVNRQQVAVGNRVRAGGIGGDREQQREAIHLAAAGTPNVVAYSKPPTPLEVLSGGAHPLRLLPRRSVVRIRPTDEEAIPYLLTELTRPMNWSHIAENDQTIIHAIAAEHGWQGEAHPQWFERPYWRSERTQRKRLRQILQRLQLGADADMAAD